MLVLVHYQQKGKSMGTLWLASFFVFLAVSPVFGFWKVHSAVHSHDNSIAYGCSWHKPHWLWGWINIIIAFLLAISLAYIQSDDKGWLTASVLMLGTFILFTLVGQFLHRHGERIAIAHIEERKRQIAVKHRMTDLFRQRRERQSAATPTPGPTITEGDTP